MLNSHLELVAKGLELKEQVFWALYRFKLNYATHEYFTIYYVNYVSLYRNKLIETNWKSLFEIFSKRISKFVICFCELLIR